MIDHQRLNFRYARPLEACSLAAVRYDNGNPRVEASFDGRVDERLKVAAAARNKHSNPRGLEAAGRAGVSFRLQRT